MKYYIIAIVLIVALAGFGVQFLDSNTGMAIKSTRMQVGTFVRWDLVCDQTKTDIDLLVEEYKSKSCIALGTGEISYLVCPNPGPAKTGYVFDKTPASDLIFSECRDLAVKIANKIIQLEKNAEKSIDCDNILQDMRVPYGCSTKIQIPKLTAVRN